MNLKKSENSFHEKKDLIDLENVKDYPTLDDLMKEQNVSSYQSDYWKKECETNPSNPRCLIYED